MILCDTSVVVDIDRGRPEIETVLRSRGREPAGISAITIQEIYVGLGYQKEKFGKQRFEQSQSRFQRILNDFEIIDITIPILEQAGLFEGELQVKGIRVDPQDYIIAATAQQVQASKVLTRNPDHFKFFPIPTETYSIKKTSQ